MSKQEILSKLNLKDYNRELEEIIEKKDFSSQVKNLLLSMFYKLEIGYKDYSTIKEGTPTKETFMESIIYTIKEKCDQIELIKPSEKEEKKHYAFPEEKKISCYPNEAELLNSILEIGDKNFNVINVENIIAKSVQRVLKNGYELDIKEALTNFDGWSWNNNLDTTDDIGDYLVYQNLRMLMGNDFMLEWKRDRRQDRDYLTEIKKKSEEIYISFIRYSISKMGIAESGKDTLNNELLELKERLEKMEEKNCLLKEIYEEKRKQTDKIGTIDSILGNKTILEEEFKKRNSVLQDEEKIFSISDLADIIQKDREKAVEQLEQCNSILDPKNYLKKMKSLQDAIWTIEECDIKNITENKIEKDILELQKIIIGHFRKEVLSATNKKEIMEILNKCRYYIYLPIKEEGNIVEIINSAELKTDIEKLQKRIITQACKNKAIVIVNQDISYNSEIIKKIINTKIIDLLRINVMFSKEKEYIVLDIYDDEVLDRTEHIEKKNESDFRIKFGKKFKIFT
ncbi:MAG: hypothetical protein IKP28_00860 [Clostridia bacterium]|nr:hypothetical protein [Clostridia bacterium]